MPVADTLAGAAVAVLALVVAVEFALMALGLVDLLRRPVEEVAGGNKLPWLLLIVLLGVIGPIVYFAAGRRPSPVVVDDSETADGRPGFSSPGAQGVHPSPAASADDDPAGRAADLLYGERPDV